MPEQNPLIRDRDVDFVLYELLHADALCALPAFEEHSRETFDLYLRSTRRLAREVLYPAYKPMDEAPARLVDGGVITHPRMKTIYPQLIALGVGTATRPAAVGGQQLPMLVGTVASAYLMAANLSAAGFVWLTSGAAHLIEAFGSEALKEEMMTRMYSGEWTGTMALTEPQAGSSLADVATRATPRGDGSYAIQGAKIFISGGDHDFAENVVHLTLGRIEGAPAGIKGVSLFAVPKKRLEGGKLVPNDVSAAGAVHKIGWRGLPSLVLSFGEQNDCHGWLVGEPNRGINYMFQMMNEARINVGVNGVATAAVAYYESLEYARNRPQGRSITAKDPTKKQVSIVEHADVRRMLLRQKAIVEGGLALVAATARYADLSHHAVHDEERRRAFLLLDMLTPIAKSFPAEWGFESNTLAVQIHGGYGYSSEYQVEAWLRDQKLNSIHEGTTGIQSLDLLGRKVTASGGEPLRLLRGEIEAGVAEAKAAGLPPAWGETLLQVQGELEACTAALGALGLAGDVEAMMRHSVDYLQLAAITVVGWLWLRQASVAKAALTRGVVASDEGFYEGKVAAAQYWVSNELPRASALAGVCRVNDDSYSRMRDGWF